MFQLAKVFLYITVPLAVGFGSFQYLHAIFFDPLNPKDKRPKVVEITPELSLSAVCKLLVEKSIIRETQSLCLYRQLKGSDAPLIPGEYELSASMTPDQILSKLESGERYKRAVEIPPGATLEEMDEIFASLGLFGRYEFDAAARNPELLTRAGIAAESFEGYLGTGAFAFARPLKPAKVLWAMMERSESSWEAKYSGQLDKLRMSRHEILTLASIIGRATGDPGERRVVSSVYHNRLENGMKLESIEALRYGIRNVEGEITEADKSLPSPYNTFMNFGLPPGPILNPDKDALEAALFPAETDKLFYGKTKAGALVFSSTLKEHQENLAN